MAEADERRNPSADGRPADRGERADRREGDAPLVGVVAHVDQERARQRLRELVGDLVEEDEREDLDRARLGEEAEERLPDRLAQRRGGAGGSTSGSGAHHVISSSGT